MRQSKIRMHRDVSAELLHMRIGLEVFKSKGVNVLNGWRATERLNFRQRPVAYAQTMLDADGFRSIPQWLVGASAPECQHRWATAQPRGGHVIATAALEQSPEAPGDHRQGETNG
eukprot:Skav234830  [mRNA]  locus=scaffold69:1111974:1121612:- [translate_table: standard]